MRYGKGPPREFPSPACRWRPGRPWCLGLTAEPTQLGIPSPLRSWQDPSSHPSLWHPWNPPGLLGTELELPAAGYSSCTRSGGLGGSKVPAGWSRVPTHQVQEGTGEGGRLPVTPKDLPSHPVSTIAASRQPGRHWPFPAVAHPPWLSCGIPGWSLLLGASQEQGQLAPQGQSGSPAESSLHCSRFSMVLLCICWKPAQSHD